MDDLRSLVSDIHDWLHSEQHTTEDDLRTATELLDRVERALTSTDAEGPHDNPTGLSDLARDTVMSLRKHIGVDVAFVFVLRTTDANMGVSLDPGPLPVDTAGMFAINGLHVVRTTIVEAAAKAETR